MSTVSERSWNSSEEYEDDNSRNRSPVTRRISLDLDLPGGVITTHCVSTVIRPGSKQTHDPLQFVKIQSTELSKKAVEQIRLAEEVKITKEKIKEVEEEWQNNLLNWKSKRRQSRLTGGEESDSGDNQQRKIKTFSEILNEKAKSGHRIGYNLHKYIGIQDTEEEESLVLTNNNNNINNNNNNNRGKQDIDTGSSMFSNEKNGSKDFQDDEDNNQLKSYEQQQAELQKKRRELNHKLQELEQLEKKQNELERQDRVNSEAITIATQSPTPSVSSSETPSNSSPVSTENRESHIDPTTVNVARNSEVKQKQQNVCYSDNKVANSNSSSDPSKRKEGNRELTGSSNENRQKSVWNYLLQQQDDPRNVSRSSNVNPNLNVNQPHPTSNSQQFIHVDSESDDDHLNDSMDADEDAEKEQMLSFRAKLSTFESLSKSEPSTQQPSKQIKKSEKVKRTADQISSRLFPSTTPTHNSSPPSSLSSSSTTVSATATPSVSVSSQNLLKESDNSVNKNRPPTAEDLAHKEEIKVFQQRLQNQNIADQHHQKHLHLTQQSVLPPANSINQNSPLHQFHHLQQQPYLDKSWSPSHLSSNQGPSSNFNQLSKTYTHQPINSNISHPHHQQHQQQQQHLVHHPQHHLQHYHSRTSSEETRESSSSTWETSNFVCDKEVEKISERMNKSTNLISDEYESSGTAPISSSVHYHHHLANNSGLPPITPVTSMVQHQHHHHSSSNLIHPHLMQQQHQHQHQYARDQLVKNMNRHSVPNLNGGSLMRGYDQQQYYLMNEIINDDNQKLLTISTTNNSNVNTISTSTCTSTINNNNNNSSNSNLTTNLNNGNNNNVNTPEDSYYSNQEQIDLIKKQQQQMMLQQQQQNMYSNDSKSSYMHHASKSQSNLTTSGMQINNLSGQQQQNELAPSAAAATYLPIHKQRAVNQSLLRYHHQQQYQGSTMHQQPLSSAPSTVASGLPQQTQKQVLATSLQQQADQQQLYSNYHIATSTHHMGKSQSTPNMSSQVPTNQLQPQAPQPQQQSSPYNINHWVIQEAELRRLHYTQQAQQAGPALMARSAAINRPPQQPSQLNGSNNTYENHVYENSPFRGTNASGLNRIQNQGADSLLLKKSNGLQGTQQPPMPNHHQQGQPQSQPQTQPQPQPQQQSQGPQSQSQGPLQLAQPLQSHQLLQPQQQKQMLSVSGKKKCSNCGDELGRGCAAMVIETLSLYYHINCFRCSVCHIQLGNGTCGTDVRVRNHKLHCHNCYSNDEAGLKFSRV